MPPIAIVKYHHKAIPARGFLQLQSILPPSIIIFRASPSTTQLNPPVSVILFIDALNLPENIAAFEREQVEKSLRQNSGRLNQPVTIYSLNDRGLFRNFGEARMLPGYIRTP